MRSSEGTKVKKINMVGKTVLITGASRGIGAAAARAFADAGANVALIARSTDEIAEIAGEIGEKALARPQPLSACTSAKNVCPFAPATTFVSTLPTSWSKTSPTVGDVPTRR